MNNTKTLNSNTIIRAKTTKTSMKILSAVIANICLINSSFAPTRPSAEHTAKMTNAFALFAVGVGRQGGVSNNGQVQALGSANAYFNAVNTKACNYSAEGNHNLSKECRYLALTHAHLLLLKQDILRVRDYSSTVVNPMIMDSLESTQKANPNYTYNYDSRLNNPQFVQIGLNDIKDAINSIPVSERTQMDQSIGARTILALQDTSLAEWTEERFLRHWNPDAPIVIILSPQAGPRTNDHNLIQLCGAIANLAQGIAPRGELHERLRIISIDGLKAENSFSGTNQVLIKLRETANMLTQPAYEQELNQKLFDARRVELSLDKIQSLDVGELTTRLKKIHREDIPDYIARDLLRKINNDKLPCDTIRELIPLIGNDNGGEKTLTGMITSDSYSRFSIVCSKAKAALEDHERSITHPGNQNNDDDQSNNKQSNDAVSENNNASTATESAQSNQSLQHVTPQALQNTYAQRQAEEQQSDDGSSVANIIYPSRAESIAESIALTGGIQPYVPRINMQNTRLTAQTLHENNSGIEAWRRAQAMQEDRESILNNNAVENYTEMGNDTAMVNDTDLESIHLHSRASIQSSHNNNGPAHNGTEENMYPLTQPAQQISRPTHNDNTRTNNNGSINIDTVPANLYSNTAPARPLPSVNNRQFYNEQIRANATSNNDDDHSSVQSFSTVSSVNPASTARSIQDNQFVMIQQNHDVDTDTISSMNTNTTGGINNNTSNQNNVSNTRNTSGNNEKR